MAKVHGTNLDMQKQETKSPAMKEVFSFVYRLLQTRKRSDNSVEAPGLAHRSLLPLRNLTPHGMKYGGEVPNLRAALFLIVNATRTSTPHLAGYSDACSFICGATIKWSRCLIPCINVVAIIELASRTIYVGQVLLSQFKGSECGANACARPWRDYRYQHYWLPGYWTTRHLEQLLGPHPFTVPSLFGGCQTPFFSLYFGVCILVRKIAFHPLSQISVGSRCY